MTREDIVRKIRSGVYRNDDGRINLSFWADLELAFDTIELSMEKRTLLRDLAGSFSNTDSYVTRLDEILDVYDNLSWLTK